MPYTPNVNDAAAPAEAELAETAAAEFRALKGHVRAVKQGLKNIGVTAGTVPIGGTGVAYTLAMPLAMEGPFGSLDFANGSLFSMQMHVTNTGSDTLNVDGIGAQPLLYLAETSQPAPVLAGQLQLGNIYEVRCIAAGYLVTDVSHLYGSNAVPGIFKLATAAEALAGNSDKHVLSVKGMRELTGMSRFVESSELGITGLHSIRTFNHGLGKVPTLVQCVLRCKVAQAGYSVGDEIKIDSLYGSNEWSNVVFSNATAVGLIFRNAVFSRKDNFTNETIIIDRWRIVFRVWA